MKHNDFTNYKNKLFRQMIIKLVTMASQSRWHMKEFTKFWHKSLKIRLRGHYKCHYLLTNIFLYVINLWVAFISLASKFVSNVLTQQFLCKILNSHIISISCLYMLNIAVLKLCLTNLYLNFILNIDFKSRKKSVLSYICFYTDFRNFCKHLLTNYDF